MADIAAIQAAVCQVFGVRQADMTSDCRARTVARPRQVAMHLATRLSSKSLTVIGRSFGNRDHTTVLAAVRRITSLMAEDPLFALRVAAVEARLQAPQRGEHF